MQPNVTPTLDVDGSSFLIHQQCATSSPEISCEALISADKSYYTTSLFKNFGYIFKREKLLNQLLASAMNNSSELCLITDYLIVIDDGVDLIGTVTPLRPILRI